LDQPIDGLGRPVGQTHPKNRTKMTLVLLKNE
jgi:hypothetical protein